MSVKTSSTVAENESAVWNQPLDLHVICNSHLDYEWTHDFQFYRMLTVRFIDSMLDIMDDVADYQFLLDSQTIPLEDYLEIRPENRERLRALVTARRLWVGPWYTAPDMTCIFGESIVRNLLIGHKIAQSFGNVLKEGYTPFGFGQCSQLPQIYAGFGIDTIWFYRGVTPEESPGYVFRWRGADGTTALCTRTTRYNFFFGVIRPMTNAGGLLDREFDIAGGKKVMHFCDRQRAVEHALVTECLQKAGPDPVEVLLADLVEREAPKFPGRAIALMNGMDTSMPTHADDAVLRMARQSLPEQIKIRHSSMTEFFDALRRDLADKGDALPTVQGERRSAKDDTPVLGDILTGRPEQKRRNARTEIRLHRFAEPLATIAWWLGDAYPTRYLEFAWKQLLRAQPHDTIGGTGRDQIEADMLNRLDQSRNVSEGLQQFAAAHILGQLDLSRAKPDDQVLVVFNPSPWERTECTQITVDLPDLYGIGDFEIIDLDRGDRVEFAIASRRDKRERVTRDIYDATTSYACSQVEIDMVAREIPALGYRTFALRKADASGAVPQGSLIAGGHVLENAFLRTTVADDGSLTLVDKQTGTRYDNLHIFVDRGEAGDPWMSRAPSEDRVFTSRGGQATVEVEQDSPLYACLKVELSLSIPAGLEVDADGTHTRRGRDMVDIPITSYLSLARDSRALDIRTVFENKARNHLLQVQFPTGLAATTSCSDTPFDVVERPIARQPGELESKPAAEPCLRFVDIHDEKGGLAVLVDGVRGYHVTEDDNRAIELTLLRAFDILLCTVTGRWELRDDQVGGHALGRHEVCYGIMPHGADWQMPITREAERVNCPMLIAQTVPHAGTLSPAMSFLRIDPPVVELSALKKSEAREALIVRLFNPTDEARELTLTLAGRVRGARLVGLDEAPLPNGALEAKGRDVSCTIGPRKILTIEVECDAPNTGA